MFVSKVKPADAAGSVAKVQAQAGIRREERGKKSDRRLSPGRLGRLLLLTWTTSGANRPAELFEQLLATGTCSTHPACSVPPCHQSLAPWSSPSPPRRGLSTRIHAPRYKAPRASRARSATLMTTPPRKEPCATLTAITKMLQGGDGQKSENWTPWSTSWTMSSLYNFEEWPPGEHSLPPDIVSSRFANIE
ncbi:hypothetical protein J3F83DRAFT_506068 [Trichoderma novae-zelandiae]